MNVQHFAPSAEKQGSAANEITAAAAMAHFRSLSPSKKLARRLAAGREKDDILRVAAKR